MGCLADMTLLRRAYWNSLVESWGLGVKELCFGDAFVYGGFLHVLDLSGRKLIFCQVCSIFWGYLSEF